MALYARLPTRPQLEVAYKFSRICGSTPPQQLGSRPLILIVFINGVQGDMTEWTQVIECLATAKTPHNDADVFHLDFDRYGVGESKARNSPAEVPLYDLREAARDLDEIVKYVIAHEFRSIPPGIILVGHSVGVPIARLYIAEAPNASISALLSVDSTMTDTDFVEPFPDPDASSFKASELPPGVDVEDLRLIRQRMREWVHPSTPNSENLDRSTTRELVPSPSQPELKTSNGRSLFVTVMTCDTEIAAAQAQAMFGVQPELFMKHLGPLNEAYHKGLLKLTTPERARGVVVAHGAGHYIHKEFPQLVADEIRHLLTII